MKFDFSRNVLTPKEQAQERFLEILPGATSWLILVGMCALSWFEPLTAAALIIAFDLYWILRLFYVNIFLVLSYMRLSIEKKTDWKTRLDGIDRLDDYAEEIEEQTGRTLKEKMSLELHRRQIARLREFRKPPPASSEIFHLIILPVARETRDIIEPGLQSFAHGTFPAKNILVIIAVEERAVETVKRTALELAEHYRKNFLDLLVTFHPDGIEGEARVKGANATFAAKAAAALLTKRGIAFENVVVSCFDADTVVTREYFSCLTTFFLTTANRTQTSFQPIPVYQNNIWETPGFARVLDIGSSFFQLIEATNPETLVTFSSHSMSFKALVDVGYWPVDIISDDSAIFWKSYIHFDGDYTAVPIPATLSMDITQANGWWQTLVSVYKQKRRWAWGVENFPIVMRAFLKSKKIPLTSKLMHGFKLFEGHVSWATWAFLLTLIGWLPAIFASRHFTDSIIYYSGQRITNTIFGLASIGLLNCIILSLLLLPREKTRRNLMKRIGHTLEWLLVPLISVFLSALPALDAQTRLMFARYMEFWVTAKSRKPSK